MRKMGLIGKKVVRKMVFSQNLLFIREGYRLNGRRIVGRGRIEAYNFGRGKIVHLAVMPLNKWTRCPQYCMRISRPL